MATASARVRNGMVAVICNRKPVGDIRSRQPKSPGQKAMDHNRAPETMADTPVKVWANLTRLDARCCKCGGQGHPRA